MHVHLDLTGIIIIIFIPVILSRLIMYIPEKYIKVIVPIQEAYFMIVIKNILEGGEAIRREQ